MCTNTRYVSLIPFNANIAETVSLELQENQIQRTQLSLRSMYHPKFQHNFLHTYLLDRPRTHTQTPFSIRVLQNIIVGVNLWFLGDEATKSYTVTTCSRRFCCSPVSDLQELHKTKTQCRGRRLSASINSETIDQNLWTFIIQVYIKRQEGEFNVACYGSSTDPISHENTTKLHRPLVHGSQYPKFISDTV
jgi:hypothetical protein